MDPKAWRLVIKPRNIKRGKGWYYAFGIYDNKIEAWANGIFYNSRALAFVGMRTLDKANEKIDNDARTATAGDENG